MRTFGVGETGGENDSCRAATGEFPVPSLDFLKNLVMPCPERGRRGFGEPLGELISSFSPEGQGEYLRCRQQLEVLHRESGSSPTQGEPQGNLRKKTLRLRIMTLACYSLDYRLQQGKQRLGAFLPSG